MPYLGFLRAICCLLGALSYPLGALSYPLGTDTGFSPRLFTPPAEVRIERLASQDGEAILVRFWGEAHAPRAIVLGVHGFTDYGRGFAHLASQLPALDDIPTMVLSFDQRGFGESASRGRWAGSAAMLADLDSVIAWIDRNHPRAALFLIGESMGAALVLTALQRSSMAPQERLRGVVLLAPAIWGWSSMPWYQRLGLELGSALWPSLQLSGRGARQLGIRPTDDEAVAAYLARDPRMLREVSIAMLVGLTDLMESASAARIPAQLPTLIAIGRQDRVIPVAAVCVWANRQAVPGPRESWLVQEQGYHMLTRQRASGEVLAAISDWMRALLAEQVEAASLPIQPSASAPRSAPIRVAPDGGLSISARGAALGKLCR